VSHLALAIREPKRLLPSLVRTRSAHGKRGISELNTWPALPPVRTLSTDVVTAVAPSAGSRSRWLLVLRKKTFHSSIKTGFYPGTPLDSFSAPLFCFPKSASRLCRQFGLSFLNQSLPDEESVADAIRTGRTRPIAGLPGPTFAFAAIAMDGSDYSSRSACNLSIAAFKVLCAIALVIGSRYFARNQEELAISNGGQLRFRSAVVGPVFCPH